MWFSIVMLVYQRVTIGKNRICNFLGLQVCVLPISTWWVNLPMSIAGIYDKHVMGMGHAVWVYFRMINPKWLVSDSENDHLVSRNCGSKWSTPLLKHTWHLDVISRCLDPQGPQGLHPGNLGFSRWENHRKKFVWSSSKPGLTTRG